MLRGEKLHPTVAVRWADDVGLSGLTRTSYLKWCRRFQARLDAARGDVRFAEITPADVADFVRVGDDGRPRADRTHAVVLGVLNQVFEWSLDPDVVASLAAPPAGNPAARLRAAARKTRRAPRDVNRKTWLNLPRVQELLDTTYGDGSNPLDVRDTVMIALYVFTGLRLSELIRVRWRDVDFSAGEYGLISVIRKGGKRAQIAINEDLRYLLFEWRNAFVAGAGPDIAELRILPQTQSLIVGAPTAGLVACVNDFAAAPARRRGEDRFACCPTCAKRVRITASGRLWPHGTRPETSPQRRELVIRWRRGMTAGVSVRDRIDVRAREAGIAHLRPHDLRRTFAAILEDNGDDLRDIQAALGHAHLATTERYLKERSKLSPGAKALRFRVGHRPDLPAIGVASG